jgi:ribosome-binding protein aMBF1 (putative translation factor)
MTIKKIEEIQTASLFFEAGLAIRLKKIGLKDIKPAVDLDKLKEIIEKEETKEWNDFHISQGERLSSLLEAFELTQKELAERMGVPAQKINDLTKNRIRITEKWANKLGDALGLNSKTFF